MRSLSQAPEQLQAEFLRFQNQWQTTAGQWNDAARHRFEREFMDGYEEIVHTTIRQMDNLVQVLAQASSQVR